MLISNNSDSFLNSKSTIVLNGEIIDLSIPKVMGILNITPDSFHDGGQYTSIDEIISRVEQMVTEGVDIIDIGATSTRPNAQQISYNEELKRIIPAITNICKIFPNIPISIDTYRSDVVKRVVYEIGDVIVNDISGGSFDKHMYSTVAKLGLPYILMHIHGNENDMHKIPHYQDITKELSKYFSEKVRKLNKIGVKDIILDPGFGFGKTIENNYELLNKINAFKVFQLPILAGISRKSMLYKLLNIETSEALPATISANTIALIGGANLLRVHDVKEAVHCIKIFNKIKEVAQ